MKGRLLRKVASVSVAASMVMLTAGPVMGQTIEELLAQIQALQAQLLALQGGAQAYTFTRDLYVGVSGADVTALQNYLKAGGYFTATPTGYFGPITRAAVAAWQAANGVSPASGYFGALSRAKYNQLVAAAPPASPGASPAAGEGLSGGEGDIVDFELLGAPSAEQASEGEEDLKVIGAKFKADGSDLRLERVEVFFSAESGTTGFSYRPWEYFEKVSVWVGGDKVAEKDADSSGAWSESADGASGVTDTGSFKDYKMTVTGINEVIDEGDEAEVYVGVTVKANLDTEDEATQWMVVFPRDALRLVDAAGLNQYAPDSAVNQTFTTQGTTDGALTLSYDSAANEARVVDVDDVNDTNGVEALAFTLKATNGDVFVTDIGVDVTLSGITSTTAVINRLHLYKGGTLLKTEVPTGAGSGQTVTFDNLDFWIYENDTESFTVKADINDTGSDFADGESFALDIDAADVTAETVDGGTATVTGSAVGGSLVGFDNGIKLALVSKSATEVFTADATGEFDQAQYVIKFNVTAFGADMWVMDGATEGDTPVLASNTSYDIQSDTGDSSTAIEGTAVAAFTSTATAGNSNFKVPADQTKEFTLTVTVSASSADAYARVALEAVHWSDADQATGEFMYTYGLDEDWRTDLVHLNVF